MIVYGIRGSPYVRAALLALARIETRPSMVATTWNRLLERAAAA
jgi:hypothetical protein